MKRKSKGKWIVLLCMVSILAAVAVAGFYQGLVVRRYTLSSAKLQGESFRIAAIADLHSYWFGEGQDEIISMVKQENPDIIFLPGDMIDERISSIDAVITLTRGLIPIAPVYYVTGSHDLWYPHIESAKEELKNEGVIVLEGSTHALEVKGNMLTISGLGDPTFGGGSDQRKRYLDILDGMMPLEMGTYNILIAHRPDYINEYASRGFDLVVSGHTHGGQIRIPPFVNGVFAFDQGFFPAYAGGKYRVMETDMVVSRGANRQTGVMKGITWPRVFNPPEVVVIDIRQ